ncbi:MAG: hypothetical protein HN348_19260 [Proteobacteria bacterium]|nr:hypothetical protein [Pseudomonadota bacterium]
MKDRRRLARNGRRKMGAPAPAAADAQSLLGNAGVAQRLSNGIELGDQGDGIELGDDGDSVQWSHGIELGPNGDHLSKFSKK